MTPDRSHYRKTSPTTTVDVYRVLTLFEVHDPCLQHSIKKLLAAGKRGAKDAAKDVAEAIESLRRWQEMRDEEDFARRGGYVRGQAPIEVPEPTPGVDPCPSDDFLIKDYHATCEAARRGDPLAVQLLQTAAERERRDLLRGAL